MRPRSCARARLSVFARLEVARGAGPFMFNDQPDASNAIVRAILAGQGR